MVLRRAVLALVLAVGLSACGAEPATDCTETAERARVAALIDQLLDRGRHDVQRKALRELDALGPVIVQPLVEVLESDDVDVFGAAMCAEALACLGTEAALAAPALTRWLVAGGGCSSACSRALSRLGAKGVPGLIQGLGSADKWARLHAADGLRAVGAPAASAVDVLIRALDDEDDEVRTVAARALGAIGVGARQALPRLLEVLNAEGEDVRYAAAVALGAIGTGDDDVIAALAHAMREDPDWSVRRAAVESLDQIVRDRTRAVALMHEALDLSGMRHTAIHGLLRRGVDEKELVDEIVRATTGRGPRGWLAAAAFLRQSGPNGRSAARDLLVKTLEWSPDSAQRIEAARALGTLSEDASAGASVAVLEKHAEPAAEEPGVVAAARAAIQAIRSR